jgi:hypothetical protein
MSQALTLIGAVGAAAITAGTIAGCGGSLGGSGGEQQPADAGSRYAPVLSILHPVS